MSRAFGVLEVHPSLPSRMLRVIVTPRPIRAKSMGTGPGAAAHVRLPVRDDDGVELVPVIITVPDLRFQIS